MTLKDAISQYWFKIQSGLFPFLEEQLGELTEKEGELVSTLELIRIEKFATYSRSLYGRPPKERAAIARAFVAKAIYLSLIHISEPTRRTPISYAVFCLKKK